MKLIILAYGSIGQRHAANIRALVPGVHLVVSDPFCAQPLPGSAVGLFYRLPAPAIFHHADTAAGAIIASPTDCHLEQLRLCLDANLPVYLEKPACLPGQAQEYAALVERYAARGLKCVYAANYRFHPRMHAIAGTARSYGKLVFFARDNLLGRYGADVAGAMAAHMFDTACWLFGPAARVDIESDGVRLRGFSLHGHGREAVYDCAMDARARESTIAVGQKVFHLDADNGMYVKALGAFLKLAETGARDSRLATLADGLNVARIMAAIRVKASEKVAV